MNRILTSEGTTCPKCLGRGIHGSVLRGGTAIASVCNQCDGYGRMRKQFEASDDSEGQYLITLGPRLTLEEVGIGHYMRLKDANDST